MTLESLMLTSCGQGMLGWDCIMIKTLGGGLEWTQVHASFQGSISQWLVTSDKFLSSSFLSK